MPKKLFFLLFCFCLFWPLAAENAVSIGIGEFKSTTDNNFINMGLVISEDLNHLAARIKGVNFYSRQRVEKVLSEMEMAQKGLLDRKSAQHEGHIVGVDYLLNGSASKAGNTVLVFVELIDVQSSRPVFVNRFKGQFIELIDLSEAVTRTILQELSNIRSDLAVESDLLRCGSFVDIDYVKETLKEIKSNQKKVEFLKKALGSRPNAIEMRIVLAEFLYEMEAVEEALAQYQAVLKIQPNCYEALFNIGGIYFDQAKYKEAEEIFLKCARIKSYSPDVYYHLALLAEYNAAGRRLGEGADLSKAEKYYLKVIKLKQNYKEAYYGLGSIYTNYAQSASKIQDQKQKLEKAIVYFQDYLLYEKEEERKRVIKQNLRVLKAALERINNKISS